MAPRDDYGDDRSPLPPQPFNFMESLLNFTAICAVCVLFLYFGSYFRGPLTSEEAAEVKAHMIEMVCSGATQGTPPYSEELCKNRPKR